MIATIESAVKTAAERGVNASDVRVEISAKLVDESMVAFEVVESVSDTSTEIHSIKEIVCSPVGDFVERELIHPSWKNWAKTAEQAISKDSE